MAQVAMAHEDLTRDGGREAPEALEALVFAERIRLLWARSHLISGVMFVSALLLARVMRATAPSRGALAWLGAVAGVSVVRVALTMLRDARPRRPAEARRWARTYVAVAAASGSVWGVAPFVFAGASTPSAQAFLTFLVAALAAGSAATNFTYLPVAGAFAVPAAGPLLVRLCLASEPTQLAMGVLMVLFGVAMAGTARLAGRAVTDSVWLRYANESWTENFRREVAEHRRDAEQLRESEALFRDLAERAGVGVYVVQEEVIVYANRRMAEIFGYTQDEMTGKVGNLQVTHPDDRALVAENMRKRLDWEIASIHYPFRGVKKDGAVVDVEVYGTRTSYRGRPAVIGTMLDVTDRNKAAQELIRAQKLESLGVLAGGIAHDFNNLLAVILGDVSLARDATPAGVAREALEEAETAALRARDLTRQLLTFSRGGEPIKTRLELAGVLRTAAAFALRGSAITCEEDVATDLWPVDGDEGQLAQVVQNLVLNAVQAMPAGGQVRLAARNRTAERPGPGGAAVRLVRVSVSDTGPGIAPELRVRVFDPYFTTKPKGTGLGLATAHSIVARHGGRIEVESEPGRGATFHVDLPAAERAAEPRPGRAPTVVVGQGRVAVMDDDASLRHAVARMLDRLGFEAVPACDGHELLAVCARARAEGRPISAAIMDLTVPGGMGGKEAVRLLREREPGVRPIVSSGYSCDPIMSEYERHGFAGVVAKPYRIEDLSEVLARVLGAASPRYGPS
jgi:PAS domain S-box-containing protein